MSKDEDKRRDADDVGGFLRGVERVGNALPHPAILFVMFAVLVIVASAVFIGFVFLSAFINLFMGGASSKWAIMAPIFLPMMYKLGLSPALTQVAYRIGDSTTNLTSSPPIIMRGDSFTKFTRLPTN